MLLVYCAVIWYLWGWQLCEGSHSETDHFTGWKWEWFCCLVWWVFLILFALYLPIILSTHGATWYDWTQSNRATWEFFCWLSDNFSKWKRSLLWDKQERCKDWICVNLTFLFGQWQQVKKRSFHAFLLNIQLLHGNPEMLPGWARYITSRLSEASE